MRVRLQKYSWNAFLHNLTRQPYGGAKRCQALAGKIILFCRTLKQACKCMHAYSEQQLLKQKKETKLYLKVAEHLQVKLYYLFSNFFEKSFEIHACMHFPNSKQQPLPKNEQNFGVSL